MLRILKKKKKKNCEKQSLLNQQTNQRIDFTKKKNSVRVNIRNFHTAQCGNYVILLPSLSRKTSVKATFSLKNLTVN